MSRRRTLRQIRGERRKIAARFEHAHFDELMTLKRSIERLRDVRRGSTVPDLHDRTQVVPERTKVPALLAVQNQFGHSARQTSMNAPSSRGLCGTRPKVRVSGPDPCRFFTEWSARGWVTRRAVAWWSSTSRVRVIASRSWFPGALTRS